MKQLMSGGRKILAWLFVCIMLISCVISGIPAEAVARNKVTDVSVIKPAISELTLKQGTGYVLKTEASPKTAKSKALRYRSSRQEVVAVSAKGKLKAKKCGKAVLTVLSAGESDGRKIFKEGKKGYVENKKTNALCGRNKKGGTGNIEGPGAPEKCDGKKGGI